MEKKQIQRDDGRYVLLYTWNSKSEAHAACCCHETNSGSKSVSHQCNCDKKQGN